MPFILSPPITPNIDGLWAEGAPYVKKNIYKITKENNPPVNYDEHTLKPHSLTHAEGSLHTLENGNNLNHYFAHPEFFYGRCIVLRLRGNRYKAINDEKKVFLWEISREEIEDGIQRVSSGRLPEKLIITSDNYPIDKNGFHSSNYIFVLSEDAAHFLNSLPALNMFGTSWKSSDYQPASKNRPIHKLLFNKAIIFELLDLLHVPEGEYFFVGFPLRLDGASESPVTPVLFKKDELPQND